VRIKRPLVAVAPKSIHDRSGQVGLKNAGAAQLANLLGRLADGQVARSALAVLDLASGCQAKTFLGRFVCLLFSHGESKPLAN
jgi:hypothetical protein